VSSCLNVLFLSNTQETWEYIGFSVGIFMINVNILLDYQLILELNEVIIKYLELYLIS